ncbi:MAG: protein kinase [Chloroflexota bacterium]
MTRETIGRYKIQSELGRGGMAAVYLAYDPNFRRNVAIKLVSVNLQENIIFRERFEREAQLIAKIEHPAIVPVYDFGEQDDQPYLVMRYMPGGALASKIKEGPQTLVYASQIITQIAPALDAVHAQGIVHRDLKPANILLDGFGNPAISDFGIAHLALATTDLTGSAIIGTPSYMSPEQVRGDDDLDGRSDIYALGVILFEMLTGNGPFRAATPLSVAMKHLTDPIPSILVLRPDLPGELDLVLAKALAKDRELRYTSTSELALALRQISDAVKNDGRPISHSVLPRRNEEVATEIDMGQDPIASIHGTPQSDSVQASPQSPSRAIHVKRSWMPQIAGISGLGLCLIVLCISLGLLGAWTWLGRPSFFAGQNQTATLTPTIQAADNSREIVLFSDDFSNPLSGWPTIQNARGGYSYQPDGYHIVVDEPGAVLWAKTSQEYQDISLYVDSRPLTAGKNGYYGLICRIQDDQSFYYFAIQGNGNYTMGKYKDSEFLSFFSEGWKQSDAINQGQINHLQADCVADTLRFIVNNALIGEARDTDLTSGYGGLLAASLDSQRFEALFNNFLITEPDLP